MDNELKEALSALLKAEFLPMYDKIDLMDRRMDGIENRLTGIDRRLDGIDTRLDGIDNRLDKIEIEQTQVKQAVLETNATVKRIELIQEQQHSIIELLSARSIEHEAKIKRIL
ncbi:hypothetical protein HZF08_29530 [Paenibacillus sp. CGMCC 1.16610]|uniref:t-SNARE coiled-coil homology domain-containing protein n=1 Tax=Paenibacillus anseongense TaxID=2682845 RepID=A0ABW9U816_9BACL|nr:MULTISPECIES: hypothetical protein [Paenibacillus]MBA2942420.1 hypothetical protein [Paenibacillus sp. CGMCC 1.16610]MVQ34495.1 hypothetical protein [Paenibacillus anseongense]